MEAWLEKLRKTNKLIIVEGKKDKEALEKLGVKNIVCLSGPIYKVIEDISEKTKEVIILTDLDREGKKLYHRLKHNLQKHGVRVDNYFREFLFKETTLTQIEGIFRYFHSEK